MNARRSRAALRARRAPLRAHRHLARLRARQRGVAALFVTAMLGFAMVLAVALAQRNVVVEEQRSANELRAARAFAAADAGLEWALARINDPSRIGDDCRPSSDAAARPFRVRMLRIAVPGGDLTALTWNDAGVPTPWQAACVRGAAGGWSCSCPADRRPTLAVADDGAVSAFVVELAPSTRAHVIRVIATGCTRPIAAGSCGDDASHEAEARLEAEWALLPALRSPPAAALTARGDVDVGAAPLGVQRDQASALALHAGGRIAASALRIDVPPGGSRGGALVAGDALLHALSADRFFARYFGIGAAAWAAQPAARRVACADDCSRSLAQAAAAGARLLAIDGDATISGPLALGSADDPIVLVATGALHLSGDVAIHGVVHAATLDWSDAVTGAAFVRGATLVGGDVGGNAGADLRRDADVLTRLTAASGSFVRVDGSWKDF